MRDVTSFASGMANDSGERCVSCSKLVKNCDKAVQREVFCKQWFHCKCVSISDEEYECMKLLAEKSKWVCKPCDCKLDKVIDRIGDIDSFIQLHFTVDKLCKLMKGVIDDNVALNDKVDTLILGQTTPLMPRTNLTKSSIPVTAAVDITDKDVVCLSSTEEEEEVLVEAVKQKSHTSTESTMRGNRCTRLSTDVNIDVQPVSTDYDSDYPALMSTVNVRNDQNTSSDGWNTVVGKKTKKLPNKSSRNPIIGTKASDSSFKIRAVEKLEWLFVSRLATDVTKDDLTNYLRESDIGAECVELKTKFNTYKSFKVGVNPNLITCMLDANFWPSGTLVRKFISRNKTTSITSRTFLGKGIKGSSVP